MGRSAQYSNEQFIKAAQQVLANEGPDGLSMQKIAAAVGATTGSVYHRFASIEEIALAAWLEALGDFQSGFARALANANWTRSGESKRSASDSSRSFLDALLAGLTAGALYTPQWCRQRLTAARMLLQLTPQSLGIRTPELAAQLHSRSHSLRRDLQRQFAPVLRLLPAGGAGRAAQSQLLQFILADMPVAAVRPSLQAGRKPPASVDELIRCSVAGFRTHPGFTGTTGG